MILLLLIIYLAFIGLGLPDGLLGSAWPTIYPQMGVPISWSGIVFMIISCGTVISSLNADRLIRRFGTGIITAVSTITMMVALFGFSISNSFFMLCLWAVPYGLGAGSVDAALNNYVALHYASRHMSWLHCMWGLGASIGPYVMSYALARKTGDWNGGYRLVGLIQTVLSAILIFSLPLWKKSQAEETSQEKGAPLSEVIRISGVREALITFFCYCAVEQTTGLWASSWLVESRGIDAVTAARFASLYYTGITLGRAASGFVTLKLNDRQMVRLGLGILVFGLSLLLQPYIEALSLAGLVIAGVGCAPIYPSMIHLAPITFGRELSQVVIGAQMASAYAGNILMPPLFGVLSRTLGLGLFPVYLSVITLAMILMFERLTAKRRG